MVDGRRDEDRAFEDEVRRIAALLYPDVHGGASVEGGRERDGVYVTDDTVAIIEATRSASQAKAQKDGAKLKSLAQEKARQYPYHAIKAFFVTEQDPTGHQLDVVRKLGAPLAAISFQSFRNRLIDISEYLACRNDYAFGSARDPETDDYKVKDQYVPLDFVVVGNSDSRYAIDEIAESISQGKRVALLGEFGVGKSMTLRELFLKFRSDYLRKRSDRFCIHLNMNDHQGQTDPHEALDRHARKIGFATSAQLVRAWRGGYAHLILDGFDEVFVPGWASGARPVREIRRKSVELVRRFVEQSPAECGVLVAGRRHFFDDVGEMRESLGLLNQGIVLDATDFTEGQVREYLRNRNWSTTLPDWLPRRPLLIGYLAGRSMLTDASSLAREVGPGWDALLDAICVREARTDMGIDSASIRSIIERLATRARRSSSGRGPLGFDDLTAVFRELQGYQPDPGALLILQRLPGLQVENSQNNSRSFIDDDLVDAARAGDLLKWSANPQTQLASLCAAWATAFGDVGLEVFRSRCDSWGLSGDSLQVAVSQLNRVDDVDGAKADLVRALLALDLAPLGSTPIANAVIPRLALSDVADCSSITFSDCIFDFVDLNGCQSAHLPFFNSCVIDQMDGANSLRGLDRFNDCEVREFLDSTLTLAGIRGLQLSDDAQASLAILKKVYVQAGAARQEGALYRGMPVHLRGRVSNVLSSLVSMGVLTRARRGNQTLYSPVRAESVRVRRLLDAPAANREDPLLASL